MITCKICNQQGNGYCAIHFTSGVECWECECRGHKEPISINDCICSPDNPKDLMTCKTTKQIGDWERKWKLFWLPLITTKGKLDIKKIKIVKNI